MPLGSSEARNHVYGLGQKLASAYHDQPSGRGSGGMTMMMSQSPPIDTIIADPDPGGDRDPPDTCYTRMTYYVNDQYGSVRCGMSETAVLTRLEYYPYGEVYSMSGGGSVYTFLGKEDPGVGMLDFGPRYYQAMLGRFLSPDPILAGASAYSYAEGNPVMLYDPSGMRARWTRTWISPEERALMMRCAQSRANQEADRAQDRYERGEAMLNATDGEGNYLDWGRQMASDFWNSDPVSWPPDNEETSPDPGNGPPMIASDGYIPESAWPRHGRVGSEFNPYDLGVIITAAGHQDKDPFPDDHQAWDVDEGPGAQDAADIGAAGIGISTGLVHNEAYWIGAQGQYFTRGLRHQQGGWANSYKVAGSKLRVLRHGGAALGAFSAFVTVRGVWESGELYPSDVIDILVVGGSFTGVGAIAGGAYIVTDLGFEYFTGTSLGDRIDNAVGGPIWQF